MSKVIRLTESDLVSLVKKVLKEQKNNTPVIDFNKLPQTIDNVYNSSKELSAAGFPDDGNITSNVNFNRYYDRQVSSSTGQYFYTKKKTAPTPNYVLSPQEKTKVGGKTATTGKYHKGFLGNFACISSVKGKEQDKDGDGLVDIVSVGGTNQEKKYFPNGKMKIFRPEPPTPHWEDATWTCSNGKVIDSFIKNKKMKPYGTDPFTKSNSSLYGGKYLPIYTTDNGSNGKIISKLQQKLINLGKLKIKRPTGNYGRMTHRALSDFANEYGYGSHMDNGGIWSDLYDKVLSS